MSEMFFEIVVIWRRLTPASSYCVAAAGHRTWAIDASICHLTANPGPVVASAPLLGKATQASPLPQGESRARPGMDRLRRKRVRPLEEMELPKYSHTHTLSGGACTGSSAVH